MKLLVVLTVLGYATAVSDLFGPGGLSSIGSDLGGRLGSGVGLGVGTALDTVPKLFGLGRRPDPAPIHPVRPTRPRPRPGYHRDGEYGDREHERRTDSSGRRDYDRRGSGGEYDKGRNYNRERSVNERERVTGSDSGRGGQSSDRGRAGGRTESRGRDRSNYSHQYD